MKVVLIPARGGSKRIPRKNIKEFCGKPMIVWSIEAAKASGYFDKIIVSTDDPEIAEIAKNSGAEVPFSRPIKLSNDHATTLEVIQHAITSLKLDSEDYLCCLYATAPFIQTSDLIAAADLLIKEKLDYVYSATEFSFPIQRAVKIDPEGFSDMFFPEYEQTRSQDLEKSYHDAGQFYFGRVGAFREGKPVFHCSETKPLLLPSYRVQDIDTMGDWKRAELMFQVLQQSNTEVST